MTIAGERIVATPPGAAKKRVAYLDNARFWVMILVVIGHPLLYLTSIPAGRFLYYWIYLFHMPMFALISGYISRNFVGTRKQLRRTVSTLVVPYFIIETTYQVLNRRLAEHNGNPIDSPMMLLSPKWVAWFLAALFIWRMSTPLWRALRHPIIVSVLISVLTPLTEVPNVLAMHKALGMLPFYVIGMHFTMKRFHRLSQTRARLGAGAVIVVSMVICWFGAPHWHLSWQKWRLSYAELHVMPLEGMLYRILLLGAGVALSLAILSLVPWRRSWTSPLGERTLYCYLLHGFVVIALAKWLHVFDLMLPWGVWAILATLAGAIALAVLLMTKPVALVFRPLFEPKLKWLFKYQGRGPGGRSILPARERRQALLSSQSRAEGAAERPEVP